MTAEQTPRRLTAAQWTAARRRWERDPRPGFEWLAAELAAAHGVAVSRQAVSGRAGREGWVKRPKAKAGTAMHTTRAAAPPPAGAPGPDAAATPAPATAPVRRKRAQFKSDAGAGEGQGEVVELGDDDAGLPPLTAAEERFAALVAEGRSKSAAYRVAFPISTRWQSQAVHSKAWALASRAEVAERITELMRGAARANEAGIAEVLREYLKRLYADPRELTEVRVGACRYCWGKGHRWQFTDGEMALKRAEHAERVQRALENDRPAPAEFDEGGGGGFNVAADPNPKCPSCGGAGQANVVLHDSRTYSEGALALFEGVKQTKDGIEVKMASRTDALEKLARFAGFFEADNAQQRGASTPVDPAELDAMYDRAMTQWQAQKEHALGRLERLRAKGVKVDGTDPQVH
jgi:hypothetical protein